MRVYADTSALLALLVPTDAAHEPAKTVFSRLASDQAELVTSSYVLSELYALIGRRLGLEAVRRFRDHFAPLLSVVWVDRQLHDRALDSLLAQNQASLSLVDAVSFVLITDDQISNVWAYDRHFEQRGLSFEASR